MYTNLEDLDVTSRSPWTNCWLSVPSIRCLQALSLVWLCRACFTDVSPSELNPLVKDTKMGGNLMKKLMKQRPTRVSHLLQENMPKSMCVHLLLSCSAVCSDDSHSVNHFPFWNAVALLFQLCPTFVMMSSLRRRLRKRRKITRTVCLRRWTAELRSSRWRTITPSPCPLEGMSQCGAATTIWAWAATRRLCKL